jgi:hypothetical protein
MDPARVRELSGLRVLEIARAIHPLDRHSTDCRKLAFGGFHGRYRYLSATLY